VTYLEKKTTKDETVKVSMRISKSKIEYLMSEYGTNSITEMFNELIDDKLEHRFQADSKRSVITSIGGKNRLAKRIIDFIPEHKPI
jgi:DNA adenine methylase